MPPLLGVYNFTAGLPPSPPTGVFAYTVGWSHHRSWASTSSPTGLPLSPPTGVFAYMVGWSHHRCWASTTSPPACLRRRRLVPPPTRLAYYAAAVGRLRLHRRLASVAAEWCLRLHGWPIMPPLLGVYDFTAGLSPSPPSGVSAYTAGLLCRRCWASTTSPPAYLRRRRLVSSPIRIQIQICIKGIHGFKLISYAPGMDQSEHHHRLASTAADWCFRLHGWPIMPPLLGVYVFTDRLAFAAADWCFRLHGWPIMPPLLGVYVFTDRPPRPPPTGVSACTAGLYAAVVRRLRLHRPACLRRRRLVFPPARLAFMPPLLGVYVFTDRPPHPPLTGVTACTAGLL
uniref:cysteine dioxygenase n=1 Tax=Oryza sativa TaxID=4530 RepID=Q01MS4_ORYSA|nr:OSIGBa0147M20.3 [Oryza sativa]